LFKKVCVHGGLSPHLNNVNTIESCYRFQEIPKQGLFCDLMWSDPIDDFDNFSEKNSNSKYFLQNASRGCSYSYTLSAVERFLKENNFLSLIRAHQVQREGIHFSKSIKMNNSNKSSEFPSMISIFSAPNYCDVYKNKAAIVQYTGKQFDVKLFTEADHPFVLPNFQDAFTWSLPFIVEKLSEILVYFLNQVSDEELQENENESLDLTMFMNNLKEKMKLGTPEPLKPNVFKRLKAKKLKIKKCNELYKQTNEIANSDLKLGSLTPSNRVRRRSSEIDREILKNLECKGIQCFEDANDLDELQYKIINSDDEDT
jgi:serine/threonine-protein phosphatase 2B catalytic subunit